MKILFMGGHELGKVTLEYLINKKRNIIGAVVTDTDNNWYKGVDEVAEEYSLTLYKEKNINNPEFIRKVREFKPDLIVVVNFEQILKEEIISIPSRGCINTHASLLPKYRGRAPLNWAILKGEKETGVTVHYIEKGIDTGDIILQRHLEIKQNDYISDLLGKVKIMYPYIVDEAIEQIENNAVKAIKQDLSQGFYCGKRTAKDGQIDWCKPAGEIYNLIRAVSRPYPGAYSYSNNKRIIVWKASISSPSVEDASVDNGTVLKANGEIVIKCKDGLINIYDFEFADGDGLDKEIICGKKLEFKED